MVNKLKYNPDKIEMLFLKNMTHQGEGVLPMQVGVVVLPNYSEASTLQSHSWIGDGGGCHEHCLQDMGEQDESDHNYACFGDS